MEQQITNRLHRSGAIDFNCSYDVTEAQNAAANEHQDKRMLFMGAHEKDNYSVCEGEPLFTMRKKIRLSDAHDRFNMTVMSSVNSCKMEDVNTKVSVNLFNAQPGNADPKWKHNLWDAFEHNNQKPTAMSWIDMLHLVKPDEPTRIIIDGRLRAATQIHEDECKNLRLAMVLHTMRQAFFHSYRPVGVSGTKWSYEMLGRQGNEFVATLGGLNTIYVDDDVQSGDTLIVDMPFDQDNTSLKKQHTEGNLAEAYNECKMDSKLNACYGLCPMVKKKGCPREKRTLVVRSMPQFSGTIFDKYLRQGFVDRGQVIGICVKSAAKGERCDIVLASNAIGMRNNKDRPHALIL